MDEGQKSNAKGRGVNWVSEDGTRTAWCLPDGCEVVAAHRVKHHGQWLVIGYGYFRQIDGELTEVHGPMRSGFIDEMLGLGNHP